MNNIILILFLCVSCSFANAQTIMTLEKAIAIALEQNYDIAISENNNEITTNNAIPGNAGLLPTLDATGSIDYGLDNTRLQFNESPEVVETTGAESWNYNASMNFGYVIFSGLGNLNSYKQLKVFADQSDAAHLIVIENIVLQVASAYYNLLRTESNIEILEQSLQISKRRYNAARNRKELSGGSGLDVLNASVNFNQDSITLMEAIVAFEEAAIELNRLLGRDLRTEITAQEVARVNIDYNFDALKQEMLDQNKTILSSKLQEQVSLLGFKIAKSTYYPTIKLSSSYSYNKSETEGSFLRLNERNGLGVNLSLSVPIYNGGSRIAAVKNARLQFENSSLQEEHTELLIESELLKTLNDYNVTRQIIAKEKSNSLVAEENFNYSEEKFKLGQISNTELREAQVNLLLSKNNLNNQQYNLRLIELELLRLSGKLVKSE
ncbi:MAG: TolC family protein [Chitinophagales bacterium]|nr:TolC family protein [Chitinophagales bacterium]